MKSTDAQVHWKNLFYSTSIIGAYSNFKLRCSQMKLHLIQPKNIEPRETNTYLNEKIIHVWNEQNFITAFFKDYWPNSIN